MKIDKRTLGVSGLLVLGMICTGMFFAWVLHFAPTWLSAVVSIGGLWLLFYKMVKD